MTKSQLELCRELLIEVGDKHADPDDPDYNGCDIVDNGESLRCDWCEKARVVIEAIDAEPVDDAWVCDHCGHKADKEAEIICLKCGKGKMIYT